MIGHTRIAAVALTAAVSVCAAGCGGGKSDAVVIKVGDTAITRSTVAHWIHVEAVTSHDPLPTGTPPKGIFPVPPDYADCVAFLHTESHVKPTPNDATLKRQCAAKYAALKHQILELLITYYWVSSEGAKKGIKISDAELAQYMGREFPTPGAREQFRKVTGESAADQAILAKRVLFSLKLQDALARSTHTTAEQAIPRFANELAARWVGRTSCQAGYVVPQCKQFHGSHL